MNRRINRFLSSWLFFSAVMLLVRFPYPHWLIIGATLAAILVFVTWEY